MGCGESSEEEKKENSSENCCNWSSGCDWSNCCVSSCPLTEYGIPFLFLIPLLLMIVGFCPLVWLGVIGCLVYKYSNCSSSTKTGFPVKIGLKAGAILLIPCLFKCCPLIWGLIIGGTVFMIKKGVCSYYSKERKNSRLINKLHRIALDCLDSEDMIVIQKAKEILQRIIELSPHDKIALYNLACTESLLGNVDEALENLDKAIDAGYSDIDHMKFDSDFNNIRNTEAFKNLEKKLQNILFPPRFSAQVEEEPREEEIKEDQMENKIRVLHELFPLLPVDTLRDIVIQCKGNVETAIETIIKLS